MTPPASRFSLRALPLAPRLVIAAFLVSVGVGYFSALVQLHFQHAPPGKMLPGADEIAQVYHGRDGLSPLERLLVAGEDRPFGGSSSMRRAFTSKSAGWRSAIRKRARAGKINPAEAEKQLRAERTGECLAVLDWIHNGADRKTFEGNNHPLSPALAGHAITPEFVDAGPDGKVRVKVAAIFETRCARCHSPDASSAASQFPLTNWEEVHDYCEAEPGNGGMSLAKLAQTTHVHLLGFAMLYGLTGLIFALTSYPTGLKVVLGPLPLVAQLGEIGLWWATRLDPAYSEAIMISGGLVALGLFSQIILSLFHLFGRHGKAILAALLVLGLLGGYLAKTELIDPYLVREGAGSAAAR